MASKPQNNCGNMFKSCPKLIKDDASEGLQYNALNDIIKPINLLIDATFFGWEYEFLVFHDCQKVLYFKEIKTESVQDFMAGIMALKAADSNMLYLFTYYD